MFAYYQLIAFSLLNTHINHEEEETVSSMVPSTSQSTPKVKKSKLFKNINHLSKDKATPKKRSSRQS